MMRRSFTCSRCNATLAGIQPADTLRVAPGVAVTHNVKYGSLALRCRCGQVMRETMPRKVTILVVERDEVAA